MKVVYKKSIAEKIDDAISESIRNNKDIDYIELNKKEWDELVNCVKDLWPYYCASRVGWDAEVVKYKGIHVCCEG